MKSSAPRYLPDEAVNADLDQRLRSLLSACFSDPCFITRRYCHEMPAPVSYTHLTLPTNREV